MTEEERREMMRSNYAAQMEMLGYDRSGNPLDMVHVVRCRECMFWQKPQVMYYDKEKDEYAYRDYLPNEIDPLTGRPGVTADVGINVGGYCNGYWTDDYVKDGCREWKGENDYCSKGCRPGEEPWRKYAVSTNNTRGLSDDPELPVEDENNAGGTADH